MVIASILALVAAVFPLNPRLPVSFGVDSRGGNVFSGEFRRVSVYNRGLTAKEVFAPEPPRTGLIWEGVPKSRDVLADAARINPSNGFAVIVRFVPKGGDTGRLLDNVTPGGSDGWLLDLYRGSPRLIVGKTSRGGFCRPLKGGEEHLVGFSFAPNGECEGFVNGKVVLVADGVNDVPADEARALGAAEGCVEGGRVVRHRLWYPCPAPDTHRGWEQRSLPIGNGWFGASVFGGVENDRVQLTHNDVETRNNLTDALDIRILTGHNPKSATRYIRGLDLETATAWTSYVSDGVTYRREYVASYPDRTLAIRLTASERGRLSFKVGAHLPFQVPFAADRRAAEAHKARRGTVRAHGDTLDVDQELQWYGILFPSRIRVVTDGKVSETEPFEGVDGALAVEGATEAVVYYTGATNYEIRPENISVSAGEFAGAPDETFLPQVSPRPKVEATLDAAVARGWKGFYDAHLRDVASLLGRARLDLGADPADLLRSTEGLLARYRADRASRYLEEMYWLYGRYLLVSSSRPGTLPANLQGVWSCMERSPWGSGYWHNINVQMNYWPAFSTNLEECFLPYAEFNKAFRPKTKLLCWEYLKLHGLGPMPESAEAPEDWWCVGTASWSYIIAGYPGGHSGPGTVGFTSKLFWEQWDFTRNPRYVEDYGWHVMRGAADFLNRCVERQEDGTYLSKYSASPEHGPRNTKGCAFDQMFIWENANDFMKFAALKGVGSDPVLDVVRGQIDHYDPVRIGGSGEIKEWRHETRYGQFGEPTHRHLSHLVGLHPGTLITRSTPAWMDAVRRSLEGRGDSSTGWALAHRINLWARTGDGDHAHKLVGNLLAARTAVNLWDLHPPFQIDGNFGGTAGITEMLLQSHDNGVIDILPALPAAWPRGSFTGLKARGNYTVDCSWDEKGIVNLSVRGAGDPVVRFDGRRIARDAKNVAWARRTAEVEGLAVDPETLRLTWTAVPGVRYDVYRNLDSKPGYESVAKDLASGEWRDASDPLAVPSREYATYKVVARAAGLEASHGVAVTAAAKPAKGEKTK